MRLNPAKLAAFQAKLQEKYADGTYIANVRANMAPSDLVRAALRPDQPACSGLCLAWAPPRANETLGRAPAPKPRLPHRQRVHPCPPARAAPPAAPPQAWIPFLIRYTNGASPVCDPSDFTTGCAGQAWNPSKAQIIQ